MIEEEHQIDELLAKTIFQLLTIVKNLPKFHHGRIYIFQLVSNKIQITKSP